MAGRSRACNNHNNKAVAVAVGALMLALLFAAGYADETCKVDQSKVFKQCASCASSGTPTQACCDELRNADFGCLCRTYWGELNKDTPYAKCARAIPSKCNLPDAKCH